MLSKQVAMPSYYPEEVWLEIFRRLPVKSLGKCMCVCKAWKFLIKNPSFISAHLNNHSKFCPRTRNNDLFLVTACFPGEGSQVEYSLHLDDQEFSKYAQLQYPPFDVFNYIVGSCRGLICLVDLRSGFSFTLCNPIIKKCISLPKPILSNLPFEFSIGFGFDSRRNDYKVLKITKNNVSDKDLQAELFSLKKNSWKKLAPLKYALYSNDCMAFANGVVHWIASERVFERVWKLLLLGFDMGDEVLREIKLPEHLSNLQERSELFVLPYGELSSIAVIQLESLNGECNIWVMKTFGVVGTWTKMLSVNFGRIDTGLMPRVLGFRRNGGLILHRFTDEQVSHQPEGNEIKNFEIRGIYAFIFRFVESLVFIDLVSEQLMISNDAEAGTSSALRNGEEETAENRNG